MNDLWLEETKIEKFREAPMLVFVFRSDSSWGKGLWVEDAWVGLGLVAGNEKLTRPVWNLAKFVTFTFCINTLVNSSLLLQLWIKWLVRLSFLALVGTQSRNSDFKQPVTLMGICEPLKTQWLKFLNPVSCTSGTGGKSIYFFFFVGWMKGIQLHGSGMECPSCKNLNRWN